MTTNKERPLIERPIPSGTPFDHETAPTPTGYVSPTPLMTHIKVSPTSPQVQILQHTVSLDHGIATDVARRIAFSHVMTQMPSEKVGLRKHGQLAEDTLLWEFTQLKDLSVFTPLATSSNRGTTKRGSPA